MNNTYQPKLGFFGSIKSVAVESAGTIITTAKVANVTVQNTGIVLENTTGIFADGSSAVRRMSNYVLEDMEVDFMHERSIRLAQQALELAEMNVPAKPKRGRPSTK